MADSKITALTALTAADPVNDMFPVVDVSDTSMAASGTTKRISVNNILSSSPTASGALTVTGLVTAGSATITGDLTVDTSALKVDSINNRVIVGHTSGSSAFQVTNAGAAGLEIQPTGVNSAPVILSYNRSGSAYTQLTIDASTIVHSLSGTTAMTLNSTGLAIANGNVILSTSGKGIDFSATANGSGTMTSELLNDYEEGTWVPTDASGAGLAFTVSNCRYTKVGRSVTIQGAIVYPATANASNATWGGFPFNSSDSFNLSIIYTDTSIANLTYISSNGTNAFLLTPGVNTLNSTVSGKYIAFSGTYMI